MNKHAAALADQELAERHTMKNPLTGKEVLAPALADPLTGKLRPLTMAKADEAYRHEWLLYYKKVDNADKKLTKEGFTEQNVGGTSVLCPSTKGWTQLEVLKILCKDEPWVVNVLQHPKAKTQRIGRILYVDKKFKIDAMGNPIGEPIDVRIFPGGGSNNAAKREINVLAKSSSKEAASTLVHEARHQIQDKKKLKTWKEQEIDAYTVGEQFRINQGLPEFGKGFRVPTGKMVKDPVSGKLVKEVIPNPAGIKKFVEKEYPVEPEWFPGDEIDEGVEDVSKGWDCGKIP